MPRAKRRPQYPAGIEREYARQLVEFARWLNKETLALLTPVLAHVETDANKHRQDADDSWYATVKTRLESLLTKAAERLKTLAPVVKRYAHITDTHNSKEFHQQVRSALSVDVFKAEPWLRDSLSIWEQENLRLIKSIPEEHVARLQGRFVEAVRAGKSLREMKQLVQDVGGVTERRAELIARDQIGKLNGQLSRQRQEGIGVTDYAWRGVLDRRERPSHIAREGRVYSYANGPPGGLNPGQEIRCRCSGDAIFPELADIKGHIIP